MTMVRETERLNQITSPLLAWYDANRRALPWREEVSPYRTWVSEIMLQQTRVQAVLPYFQRFMEAAPDAAALVKGLLLEYVDFLALRAALAAGAAIMGAFAHSRFSLYLNI